MSLVLPILSGLAQAQEDAPAGPQPDTIEVIYTGHRGGVGVGMYPFATLEHLRDLDTDASLTDVESFRGTLAQGRWLLQASDQRVASVLALFDGTPITCSDPVAVEVLETALETTILTQPGATPILEPLALQSKGTRVEYLQRQCSNASGSSAVLTGPDASEPWWVLSAFEFRPSLRLTLSDGAVLNMIGIQVQEAARMMAALENRRQPETLYVDAGDFVDGVSTAMPGALSQHRALGFDMLRRLNPDALAPGHNELVAGAAGFLLEAAGLPYVATNWSANDPDLALPPYQIISHDALDVGVIAILDPSLTTAIPTLAAEGITITDPIQSVQAVVDEMYALESPPDTIIALTTASSSVMEDIRRRLRGVDVMLGDPTFATLRIEERLVQMRPLPPGQKGAPLTLAMDGLAVMEMALNAGELESVRSVPIRVLGSTLLLDAEVQHRITDTRAVLYPPLDKPLLPALAGVEAPEQAQLETLVCETIRKATGADTVLLRNLPEVRRLPGPMSELQVLEQLGLLDTLVSYEIPGSAMGTMMDRTHGIAPVACGATLGSPKAWGRSIESSRLYRVVTTDQAVNDPVLSGILGGLTPTRPLDGPGREVLQDEAGAPRLLSDSTVQMLRQIRDEGGGPEAIGTWLAEAPSAYPQQWQLNLSQLDLQLARFQGTENESFASVPETLATSPSSLTLGSAADVSLQTTSARMVADLHFQGSYTAQRISGEDFAESADDWKLSTSGALPWLVFPLPAPLHWMPYSELLYDSEFTPTEDETGAVNPRQADLSLAVGLSSKSWGVLKNVRLGAFANQDLSRLGEKVTEFGGKSTWSTALGFHGLTWSTTGDVQVFASTPDDDVSDLRLKFTGDTRLAMPMARYLSLDLYAQGFALKGRVVENQDLGMSWTLGTALDVSGVFAL